MSFLKMTNATKALIISGLNGAFGLADAFHLVLTAGQRGAIITAVNGILAIWVGVTYQMSAKRTSNIYDY